LCGSRIRKSKELFKGLNEECSKRVPIVGLVFVWEEDTRLIFLPN
jgi:hypothetical protein